MYLDFIRKAELTLPIKIMAKKYSKNGLEKEKLILPLTIKAGILYFWMQ